MPSDTNNIRYVVLWERHNGHRLTIWEPYTAEISELIERSYAKKLSCVYLGDVDPHFNSQFVYFDRLEQRKEDSSVGAVSVRRSIYPLNSCPGRGIYWQWYDSYSRKWHTYIADIQDYIENSYQNNESGIDLSKLICPLPYVLDFAHMMQRRKATGKKRSVRRCEGRPYPLVVQQESGGQTEPSTSNAIGGIRKSERISQQSTASSDAPTVSDIRKNQQPPLQKCDSSAGRLENSSSDELSNSSGPSARFLSWFKTPLFRSGSSPNNLSESSDDTTTTITTKKQSPEQRQRSTKNVFNGVSSKLIRGKSRKRPTHKSRCVVRCDPSRKSESVSVDEFLEKHTDVVSEPPTENCTICYETLSSLSSYDVDDMTVSKLNRCGHHFHRPCITAMLGAQSPLSYMQCPTCKVIYGVKIGNQPPGKMEYFMVSKSLPGYEGHETICIVYDFRGGIQGSEHPCPNRPYSASTFPRSCYLPDNEKGRMILRMLIVAWQRRLTFTIGSSVTTGESNVVTWNEIHHKTEFGSNHSGHGYPDPNYFDNVLLELAAQGVVVEDVDDDDSE